MHHQVILSEYHLKTARRTYHIISIDNIVLQVVVFYVNFDDWGPATMAFIFLSLYGYIDIPYRNNNVKRYIISNQHHHLSYRDDLIEMYHQVIISEKYHFYICKSNLSFHIDFMILHSR